MSPEPPRSGDPGPAAGVRTGTLAYSSALDGIRAISIVLVVGLHSPWLNSFPFNRGWVGVDIFFVLSGYLITTLLLREKAKRGTISLKHFYLRRALRILPALYAWVAVLALTRAVRPPILLLVLLYVANIAMATGRVGDSPAAHAWSLCIEEQFYAFWPWLVRAATRRRLLAGTLIAVFAIALWRLVLLRMGVAPFPGIYMRPDTRMDVPLWGCAAALVEQEEGFGRWRDALRPLAAEILALLLAAGLVSYLLSWKWGGSIDYSVRLGFTVNAAIAAALVLWIRAYPRSLPVRFLGAAPLAWIGRLSYSIYLWHRVAFQAGEGISNRVLGFSVANVPARATAGP
ncbi:MAG: acyltransferase family protein, partial [Thermoanaerobaculia bacterium]